MGHVCNGLMTSFRIIQLMLSITTLTCGALITYTMLDMSSAAQNIELGIENLTNTTWFRTQETDFSGIDLSDAEVSSFLDLVNALLIPPLHALEGVPTRAIILIIVSTWSICMIIYLLIAQRATKQAHRTSNPSPKMNKKSIRITLELLTLLHWLAGIICASLLAASYGAIVITTGAQLTLAWSAIKPIIEEAVESLVADGTAVRELGIVDDLFNVGAMAILAVVASVICGTLSFVSLGASCWISGKVGHSRHGSLEKGAMESFVPLERAKAGFVEVPLSSPTSMYPESIHYPPRTPSRPPTRRIMLGTFDDED